MGIADAIAQVVRLILWVLGFVMEKSNQKKEAKKKYYEFVQKMSEEHKSLASLKLEAEEQLKKLKEEE